MIQFFNTQQVELVERYTERLTDIQRSTNQLNHGSRLADELMNQFLVLDGDFSQANLTTNSEVLTTTLQNLRTPVADQNDRLRPIIQGFTDVVQQIHTAITQNNVDIVNINRLHDMLIRSIGQLRLQVTAIIQLITQLLQQIRQIRTTLETEMRRILDGHLSQQQTTIVNNVINARNIANLVVLGRQSLQARIDQLNREDLNQEERLLQNQLIIQMRIFIQNENTNLVTLRQYENQNRHIIQADPNIRRCLSLDTIKRRLQQIEAQNGTSFQQAEIILQQISKIEADPEGHQFFPKITNGTLWSQVYRKVANDPERLNQNIVSLYISLYFHLLIGCSFAIAI